MKEYLLACVVCTLAGNSRTERPPLILEAKFLSTNFVNIFTWTDKEETPPGTVYYVQHKRYGEEWKEKSQCQNITHRFCNVTRETKNFTERYYARVRAAVPGCCASEWVQSLRFCPREDTNIGHPGVKIASSSQSLQFFIQPPYTPLKDEDNQSLTVVDIFNQFGEVTFELMMFCRKTQQKWVKTEMGREFEISDLDPDTEYNGTVSIKYADKTSKPYVFRVRTLPDLAWMPYMFVVILLVIVSIFGTTYYLVDKYTKRYATERPKALDFKEIPGFQPLVPNAEEFLVPCGLSKPTQRPPAVQPLAQVNSHLLGSLEHQKTFGPAEIAYQQQAKMPPSQTVPQPTPEMNTRPGGYAPQVVKGTQPSSDAAPLPLTYGLCVEGDNCTRKAGSSPTDQPLMFVPFVESPTSGGHYLAQKPEYKKQDAWATNARQEPVFQRDRAGEIPRMLLQGDPQLMPTESPSSLGGKSTAAMGESPGGYKKQAGASFLEPTQSAGLAHRPPSISRYPCSHPWQDPATSHPWSGWDGPLLRTQGQFARHPTGRDGLANEPEASGPAPGSPSDSVHDGELFTDLFKDLELKIQWEEGADENALVC